MGIARQLYQLQEVDLELESNERALAWIVGQLGESQAVASTRNEFARQQQRLEELKGQQHSIETCAHWQQVRLRQYSCYQYSCVSAMDGCLVSFTLRVA